MTITLESKKQYFNLINPKYISWNFYEQYINIEPNFGELGLVVYLRTYSRFVEELNRREKWCETVLRVVEYSISLDTKQHLTDKIIEAEELFDSLFNLKIFAAGRSYWISGSKQTQIDGSANWNCTYCNIDTISSFTEIFYWLMIGAGTGFSVEQKHIGKLPRFYVNKTLVHQEYEYNNSKYEHTIFSALDTSVCHIFNKVDLTLTDKEYFKLVNKIVASSDNNLLLNIGDSKEGWCNALRILLTLYTSPNNYKVFINYNNIRPKGELIKTFGGRSSGYKNLQQVLEDTYNILVRCNGVIDSLAALDVVNIIGRGVVSGGVRRCLPKGTLIHLKKGLTPIENVKVGDLVATSKGYYPVTDWIYQGTQQISKIETQLGIFECTAKHKIAVINDISGNYIWKKAYELQPDDRLVFIKNKLEGSNTDLPIFNYQKPKKSTTCKDIIIPELDNDLCWLIGYLHGNGYVYLAKANSYVSFAVPETLPDIKDRVVSILKRFGTHVKVIEPKSKDKSYKITTVSKQLALYFSTFKQPNLEINIPEFILNGTIQFRQYYLAGLSDADGCYRTRPYQFLSSVYPKFLKQVQILLSTLGIPSIIKLHRPAKNNWKALYHLNIKGVTVVNDFIEQFSDKIMKFEKVHNNTTCADDFSYPADLILNSQINYSKLWSKQQKNISTNTLQKCTNQLETVIPIKVLSVTHNTREDHTYDISVDSAHEFICDSGYLVHNTAEIALGDSTDIEFTEAKYNLWSDENKKHYQDIRVMSNNSLMFYKKPTYEELESVINRIKNNGEPGFYIIGNAKKYDELIEGTNPLILLAA